MFVLLYLTSKTKNVLFYLGTPKNKLSIHDIVNAACKDAKIYTKYKIVSSSLETL